MLKLLKLKKRQQLIVRCKICGRDFETTRGLYKHALKEHNLDKQKYIEEYTYEFECLECGRKLKSQVSLNKHIKEKHSLSEYYLKYINPDSGTCKYCGKPTKFIDTRQGFRNFCNSTCANYFRHANRTEEQRKAVNAKISKTNKLEETKAKYKQTCLDKYGVDNASKSEEVKEKIRQRHIELFGCANAFQSKEAKEKSKQTCLQRFGYEYASQSPEFKEKAKKTVEEKIKKFELENDCTLVKNLEFKHIQKIITSLNINLIFEYDRSFIRNGDLDLSKFSELDRMFEKDKLSSSYELEIYEWLKSIYSGDICTNRYDIIRDSEAKQLDFLIPEKKLAIEFNGNYYHSVNAGKNKNYHLNKTLLCQEKDIRLIHIFEYEWISKKNICKSIISYALGIYERKIYARNCEVKEVSSKEVKEFLNVNHLQGYVSSSYRIGLYFNDELIQLLCFGQNRFKKNKIELLRFCTKLNTQVVGGFSKLLKHQPYANFISYIDLSKFDARGYLKNNFEIISRSSPNYKYIKNDNVISRQKAQKHKLPKLLGDKFDDCKTETQNMLDAGWYKIYDCGNLKLLYSRS
jgi:putative hef-like homing endonuclease